MEQMRTVWAFMEEEVEKCRKYCVKPKQDKEDGVVILEEGFRSVNRRHSGMFLIHELLCENRQDAKKILNKCIYQMVRRTDGTTDRTEDYAAL